MFRAGTASRAVHRPTLNAWARHRRSPMSATLPDAQGLRQVCRRAHRVAPAAESETPSVPAVRTQDNRNRVAAKTEPRGLMRVAPQSSWRMPRSCPRRGSPEMSNTVVSGPHDDLGPLRAATTAAVFPSSILDRRKRPLRGPPGGLRGPGNLLTLTSFVDAPQRLTHVVEVPVNNRSTPRRTTP